MDVVSTSSSTSLDVQGHGHHQQLAQQGLTPLIPMAVASSSPGGTTSTQQVQLVSSPGGNHQYMIGTLKLEPPDPAPSGSSGGGGGMMAHGGSGSTTTDVLNLPPVLVQSNGALHYVKVEVAQDSLSQIVQNHEQVNVNVAGTNSSIRIIQQPSTADLANNMLATISGQSQQHQQQHVVLDPGPTPTVSSQPPNDHRPSLAYTVTANHQRSGGVAGARTPRRSSKLAAAQRSSEDGSDGEGEDIYIDTKELCKRIAYELKQHSIPQAIFAERVLCRSQGTLSDLLRNPKPWNKLKSGRETFRRMYGWLKQPIQERLNALELWKVAGGGGGSQQPPTSSGIDGSGQSYTSPGSYYPPYSKSAATTISDAIHQSLNDTHDQSDSDVLVTDDTGVQSSTTAEAQLLVTHMLNSGSDEGGMVSVGDANEPQFTEMKPVWTPQQQAPPGQGWRGKEGIGSPQGGMDAQKQGEAPKRPRLVFTDIQKRTLQAIFKETQRPSKEMQQTIAEHLGLDLSTVQNFFMNARRRSRLQPIIDGPAPNQQIRPITPPPVSPPPGHMTFASAMGGRNPAAKRLRNNPNFNPEHIATIEDTVEAVANTGRSTEQHQQPQLQNLHNLGLAEIRDHP